MTFAADPFFQNGALLNGVPRPQAGLGTPAVTPPIVQAPPLGAKQYSYRGGSFTVGQIVAGLQYEYSAPDGTMTLADWDNIAFVVMTETGDADTNAWGNYNTKGEYQTFGYPGDPSKQTLPAPPYSFAARGYSSAWSDPANGHLMAYDINKVLHDYTLERSGGIAQPVTAAPPGYHYERGAFGNYLVPGTPVNTLTPLTGAAAPSINPNVTAFVALSIPSQTKLLSLATAFGLT